MVRVARFKNFKALRDIQVDFDRLTVFVGPNGSGKTTVLQGLHYLSLLSQHRPSQIFRGNFSPEIIRSSGTTGPIIFELEATWAGEEGSLTLALEERQDSPSFKSWWYRVQGQWGKQQFFKDGSLDEFSPSEFESQWKSFLRGDGHPVAKLHTMPLLHLDPDQLAEPSYSYDAIPELGHDGEGLASVLEYMVGKYPNDFQSVKRTLSSVIPRVQDVRLDRVKIENLLDEGTVWGKLILFDLEGAPSTPATAVSDGTLLVLGLLAALWSPSRPRTVLVDDLETGLHPKAQSDLIDVLQAAFKNLPEIQIIATTHSPYLVDRLESAQIRLMTMNQAGSAVYGRLIEHPEYHRWKETMLPGEFWSMVGEKWLTEARAHADAKS